MNTKRFVLTIILLLLATLPFGNPASIYAGPKPCDFIQGSSQGSCENCISGGGAWTSFGCIDVSSTSGFVSELFTFGLGMAGGIAFLLILFGGFQILTSVGNPEKLQAGKEVISAAIAGLLMIMFSVFLLRLIGVDILGLPEFK